MKTSHKFSLLGIIGIPAVMASAQAALVAHFKLDEDSGATTAFNELGNNAAGYNGAVVGAVTTGVTGISGNAYQFNGNGANHVIIDNPAFVSTIASGDAITMSAWIRRNGGTSSTSVVSLGNKTPTDQYYQLSTNGNFARVVNRSAAFEASVGDVVVNNNAWHHLVGTVSYNGTDTFLQLYVDGVLDASRTVTGDVPPNALNVFTLGVLSRNNTDLNDSYSGLIDDVQIYDEVLNSTQVSFLFANPGVAIPEPGTAVLSLLCLPFVFRRKR